MFSIICLVSCGSSSDDPGVPQPKAAPNTVAFMGDSITANWDLTHYDSMPTLNFGVSGNNTTQMAARFHNEIIDSEPAVVVILGGINDFEEVGQSGTNTDEIQMMAAEASAAGIKVILCSVLPSNYPNPNLNLPEIEAFNQELLEIAQKNGYLYADYYDEMINTDGTVDDSLFFDKIHPNSAGYARMWKVLAPLIEEDLSSSDTGS